MWQNSRKAYKKQTVGISELSIQHNGEIIVENKVLPPQDFLDGTGTLNIFGFLLTDIELFDSV